MILVMAVMLAVMFGGGYQHMGMMGHVHSKHQNASSTDDQHNKPAEHRHRGSVGDNQ